jgi:putative hemolysin
MSDIIVIICLVTALLFIAFFIGMETALLNASRVGVELRKKQGKKSGFILSDFMENPSKFISISYIGVNLFLVVFVISFGKILQSGWQVINVSNPYIQLVFDSLLFTIVLMYISVYLSKTVFKYNSEKLALFFASFIQVLYTIFNPIAIYFAKISEWILDYLMNIKVKNYQEAFGIIDEEHLVQQTKEHVSENNELNTELFENALSLPGIRIRQCLVPRTEIISIDINNTIVQAQQQFISTRLSKLIVYEDNIDNILGYIHQLDLFSKPQNIQQILKPISAVPESMSATDLINKFTKERKSIAWVVDEFGGTAGIVTMEDVLEEIFGEIQDEYDVEEFVEKQLSENEYIFSGRLELDYLQEKYNIEFPPVDSETLSGYIISHHENIPIMKERIIIDNMEFEILNVSETRIDMVKLKLL